MESVWNWHMDCHWKDGIAAILQKKVEKKDDSKRSYLVLLTEVKSLLDKERKEVNEVDTKWRNCEPVSENAIIIMSILRQRGQG